MAGAVQIALCRLAYDGRYVLSGFREFLERSNDVGAALEWAKGKINGVVALMKEAKG